MNIHPLWAVCILVRLSLIYAIIHVNKKKNKNLNRVAVIILLIMGLGFLYQGYFGSNNEIQLRKVFWHETRYMHGIFYIMASFYLYKNNVKMSSLILLSDVIFSFLYRFVSKK